VVGDGVEERKLMKRKKRALAVSLAALAAIAVALAAGVTAGSAKSHNAKAAFKVAWIYVSPHNDAGWSQAHDQGRLYVQKMLGSKVQTTYKENIAVGAQLQQTVASLVNQGYNMIFGTSYGFFDKKLAAKYPKVLFEQATGTDTAKNLSEYFGAAEDTVYLSGMAAGAATKNGTLGYVVAYPIPEVIRHANAFALGAQAMHPGVKVKLVWTNSWFDPAKEKKAAESLHGAGADVLGQNVDSPATGQFAESVGIPWVGYDSNAQKFAPKSWLTASVYDWGPYYLRRVKAALNGTWKSGFYYGSIKDGFTKLAPYGPSVTAGTKVAIAKKMQQIEKGSFYEFAGPLYDQSGKLRVAKGKRMTVSDLYSMTWLVKGVIGSPTGK
jgi:basic membrane protein A and related proteins